MTTVDSWDQSVRTSTFNFVYEDSTVWLRIGNERFKVSRRRLCTASPVFATMFELLKDKEAIVILHNNVHEFKDFLWYLHVSHTDFKEYNAKCAPKKRYHRALNIASIAHFYQATAITEWAVSELFELRPSCGALDLETLKKMHEFASRYGDRPDFLPWVQEYWCDQVDESEDPIGWLVAAKEVRNTYLQAYAYFYVLRKSNSVLRDDNRLTMLDRMRLHMGAANLQRHGLEGYKCDSTMWDGHTPAYIPPSRRNTYTGDVLRPSELATSDQYATAEVVRWGFIVEYVHAVSHGFRPARWDRDLNSRKFLVLKSSSLPHPKRFSPYVHLFEHNRTSSGVDQ